MKYEQITREESMALSKNQFIDRCLAWNEEFNDGKQMDVSDDPSKCPVHLWIRHNNAFCMHDTLPNTVVCEVCGEPCCPDCGTHHCEQLSRVTGYIGAVSGWNASKKQEFEDRQRTDVATFS
jgi:hypothetical protein